MLRVSTFAVALAAPALLAAAPAEATSFDCRYARIPAEFAICDSRQLGRLDERMAEAYFYLVNTGPNWATRRIKREQTSWLAARDDCGYDNRCIRRAYRERIDALAHWEARLGL